MRSSENYQILREINNQQSSEMQPKHHANDDCLYENNTICNTCCKQAGKWGQS